MRRSLENQGRLARSIGTSRRVAATPILRLEAYLAWWPVSPEAQLQPEAHLTGRSPPLSDGHLRKPPRKRATRRKWPTSASEHPLARTRLGARGRPCRKKPPLGSEPLHANGCAWSTLPHEAFIHALGLGRTEALHRSGLLVLGLGVRDPLRRWLPHEALFGLQVTA